MTQPENTLATLNALRAKTGRGPLRVWKESQTKLVETIALLRNQVLMMSAQKTPITVVPPAVASGAYKTNTEAAIATGHTTEGPTSTTKKNLAKLAREEGRKKKKADKVAAKAAAKEAAKSAPKTVKESKPKTSPNGITLVAIAKRIPIEGRHARQKMRRVYAGDTSKLPKRIDDQWVFSPKDADKIEKLLRADHRKNGE